MGELKSGDIAKHSGKKIILDRSRNVEIIESYEKLTLVCAYGWVQTRKLELVEEDMKYTESNRYKLQQAIKATGFKIGDLSLATGNAKTYLTGFTAESRFNSRGDITEERLNSLLTTLAFAERELLGVGAKTVDDIALDETQTENEVSVNVNEMKNQYYDSSKSNDLYSNYFESASKRNQSKRDAKVKNFLIAFLVVVVILAIYFFTR